MDYLLAIFVVYIMLLVLLCFAGIAVNAVMLLVLHVHPETRTPQSILLINLCISDLVFLLGGTILILTVAIMGNGIVCYVTVFFSSFAMALNVYLVAALCLQRYICLRKFRNTYLVEEKKYKYSLLIALGVWLLAIVLAAVEYILLRPNAESCAVDLMVGIPLYRLVMYATVPSAVIIALDIANCRLIAAQHGAPNGAVDREKEGRKIHFRVILLYFFTYPTTIFFAYVVATCFGKEYYSIMLFMGSIMTTLNAFFHPIVMCIANEKIRVLFKDYCCCRRCCQQPHQSNAAENQTREEISRAV